jgi:hypothetical protein
VKNDKRITDLMASDVEDRPMKCVSWSSLSYHVLGGATIVHEIPALAKHHFPYILCVLETQLPKKSVENLCHSLGFANSLQ